MERALEYERTETLRLQADSNMISNQYPDTKNRIIMAQNYAECREELHTMPVKQY